MEFLPTSEESAACRGLHEASLVSVSVDHQVHHQYFIRLFNLKALIDIQQNSIGNYFESSLFIMIVGVCAQCEQPVHDVFTGGDAARRHRAPSHFCACELFGTLVLVLLV